MYLIYQSFTIMQDNCFHHVLCTLCTLISFMLLYSSSASISASYHALPLALSVSTMKLRMHPHSKQQSSVIQQQTR